MGLSALADTVTPMDDDNGVETSGQESKKPDKGALIVVGLIAAVIAACCFGGFGDDDEPNEYNVQGTCKDIVRKQLKNPSTADFSDEQQTDTLASGLVAADNALGGTVTYSYRCSRSGDTVKLESLTERK